MKLDITHAFKQISRRCPDMRATLAEFERHLRETIAGKYTLIEFAECYCLDTHLKPDESKGCSGHMGAENDTPHAL